MVMRHLTEEEIQAYLDAPPGEADAEIRHHLETCRQCREVLEDYETLYGKLADDPAYAIPHDLAASVLSGLGLGEAGRRLGLPGDIVLVACAIAAMLVGVLLFADLGPILDAASESARPVIAYVAPYLEASQSRLAESGAPTILTTSVLILALIGLLDLAFRLKRLSEARREIR